MHSSALVVSPGIQRRNILIASYSRCQDCVGPLNGHIVLFRMVTILPEPMEWFAQFLALRLDMMSSPPAPGRLEAIEAQIRDEIAVMQGVMISGLCQDEHLVCPVAPEVRRGIEVRIGEP